MATATFYKKGDMVDYTPGSAVSAGDVVVLGSMVCVATRDIAANELGALARQGIFKFPKDTGSSSALAVGTPVYWDASGEVVTSTAGSNKKVGITTLAAAASASEVQVALSGGAGN